MNNKFKIGIIGAGKVGSILALAYRNCGHEITGIYTCSAENIERNEVLLPKVPVCTMEEVIEKSEIVFFTIPDDELESTIRGLGALGAFKQGQILVHTSGRCGLDVFSSVEESIGISIHPIMTFTGTSLDLPKIKNASFAVNAPKMMIPLAQALVMELGAMPIIVDDDHRDLYHAALSHGANHLAVIVNQSLQMLTLAGIDSPEEIVRPLFEAALERALMQKVKGISGPVPRADIGTISKHIEAMENNLSLEAAELYISLCKESVRQCLSGKVISENTADRILKILNRYSK